MRNFYWEQQRRLNPKTRGHSQHISLAGLYKTIWTIFTIKNPLWTVLKRPPSKMMRNTICFPLNPTKGPKRVRRKNRMQIRETALNPPRRVRNMILKRVNADLRITLNANFAPTLIRSKLSNPQNGFSLSLERVRGIGFSRNG